MKLAYNVKTGEAVAVKIIDTNGEKAAVWDDVRKEVALTSNGVLTYKLVTHWYRPACRYIILYFYCICVFYRPADRYYILQTCIQVHNFIQVLHLCFFYACTNLSSSCAGNSGRLARVKTYKLCVGHAVVETASV